MISCRDIQHARWFENFRNNIMRFHALNTISDHVKEGPTVARALEVQQGLHELHLSCGHTAAPEDHVNVWIQRHNRIGAEGALTQLG